ncbi:YdcF family protein [Paenibacillus sp. GD4]|uniref:YdcF family protein n=1 Tax=Paenibacillus sp. GD4 TaxID=3068890 RepID=UPI0027968FA9|nr:YdcF family protein [Paenibacillus sp. GD4]MDQ1910199.1 YdcF family protein [Paenibacillus sp. GD4]
MMLYILKNVYGFILPPGLFIVLLAGLAYWLHRKGSGRGTVWAAGVAAVLLCAGSIPLVGDAAIRSLEQKYPVPSRIEADGIVMLTGGANAGIRDIDGVGGVSEHTLPRVVTAALLHKQTKLPVLVSEGLVYEDGGNEGQLSKRKLVALGVAERSIVLEDKSRSTQENAANSKVLLRQLGWSKPLLVTSAFHMQRAVKHFREQGIEVIPYPTGYRVSAEGAFNVNKLIPSADALDKLSMALKEYIGLLQ